MNAVVQFNPSQVPAFARKAELSETAKALAGSGAGGKRISIAAGVFRLLDNGKEIASIEERYLDVVVIKAAPKVGRVWYATKYDPDNAAAPDCWSADGDTPSPDSASPQAKTCASCPQNVAGSGQGNSRACRYQQRIAVVLANDIEGAVMQLALPATSLFGEAKGDKRPLQEYARWLAAQRINPETVVTRMRFDLDADNPKLVFKAMRWLSDDEYATVEEKAGSEEALKAVTMTVAKRDNVAPAQIDGTPPKATKAVIEDDVPPPPPKAKKAAPVEDDEPVPPPKAKKAAPVVEDDEPVPPPKAKKAAPVADDEDAEEPGVRKPAAKPSAPPKADLAKALSDWDDE